MTALHVGAVIYGTSVVVGVLARIGRFRRRSVHHVLYGLNVLALALAAWSSFQPALVAVGLALVALPFWRGGTRVHMALGTVGAVGYVVALSQATSAAVTN